MDKDRQASRWVLDSLEDSVRTYIAAYQLWLGHPVSSHSLSFLLVFQSHPILSRDHSIGDQGPHKIYFFAKSIFLKNVHK